MADTYEIQSNIASETSRLQFRIWVSIDLVNVYLMNIIKNILYVWCLEAKYICFNLYFFRYDTLKFYRISGRFIYNFNTTLSGDIQNFPSNVVRMNSLKKDSSILIHFQSDYTATGRGFHIWYQSSKYLFSVHVVF